MNSHAQTVERYIGQFGTDGQMYQIWRRMLHNIQHRVPTEYPDEKFEQVVSHLYLTLNSIYGAIKGSSFNYEGEIADRGTLWEKNFLIWKISERKRIKGNRKPLGVLFRPFEDHIAEYIRIPEAQTDLLDWILIDYILCMQLREHFRYRVCWALESLTMRSEKLSTST